MDPNRLTQKSQEALHDAQTKALRYGHTEVDTEHLLLALLDQVGGMPGLPGAWPGSFGSIGIGIAATSPSRPGGASPRASGISAAAALGSRDI